MSNRAHRKPEGFAGGRDRLAVRGGHGLSEGSLHHADDTRPIARRDPYRVDLDACIRRIDEHCAEVLDVTLEASHLMPIRPVNEDVLRVALVQANPVLIAEDVEV